MNPLLVTPLQVVQPIRGILLHLLLNLKVALVFLSIFLAVAGVSSTVFFLAESGTNQMIDFSFTGYLKSAYFTLLNMTVGFGEIHPRTTIGYILAVLNALWGLVSLGMIVACFTLALSSSNDENPSKRKISTPDPTPPPSSGMD